MHKGEAQSCSRWSQTVALWAPRVGKGRRQKRGLRGGSLSPPSFPSITILWASLLIITLRVDDLELLGTGDYREHRLSAEGAPPAGNLPI